MSSTNEQTDNRLEKGAGVLGLAKLLRAYGRTRPLAGLADETIALLQERVLVSKWYPLRLVWDMLDFTYTHMLERSPTKAIELGVAGGHEQWTGTHRILLRDEPIAGLLGMAPSWDAYFNFGELVVEPELSKRAVVFIIQGYPDAPEAHSLTIAGWHLAAARLCGAPTAQVDLLRQPYLGDKEIVHRISW